MDFSIFLAQFNSAKDKESVMKKRIKTEYVSYALKMTEAKEIVRLSSIKKINDAEVFIVDSPLRYFLFITRLFKLYTDITWDDNIVSEVFDKLNSSGAIEVLISCISEKEYTEFNTVLQMTYDDYVFNNRSITSFLETKLDAITIAGQTILEPIIEKLLGGDEIVQTLQPESQRQVNG